MTTVLLIDKYGVIKQSKVKEVSRKNIFNKCSFKTSKDFDKRTTWNVNIDDELFNIELWSKNSGQANTENKYDFPPPIDNELYFGTCCLIRIDDNDNIIDFTKDKWEKIYENLFGGFEDIDSDEEPSEDELTNVPAEMKTKSGYLKDGFVVNTDSDKENESVDDDYEEESDSESNDESSGNDELEYEIYEYSDDDK
tara:strand:- start:1118 stop:1705 length:588 start_codon:yes stop_codon:yes gene_type:complete